MIEYPDHLNDCIEDATSRFAEDASGNLRHYQIVCKCGGRLFDVEVSDRQSVVAVCDRCSNHIVVYDLAFYPAAVKLGGTEKFYKCELMPKRPAQLFVRYEYGPFEPDISFDRNDVTWCQVFAEAENGDIVKIFDDETA